MTEFTDDFNCGVPLNLPPAKTYDSSVDHAPKRPAVLDKKQRKQAIANALRYFPSEWHEELALEFSAELDEYGHIYMYRFRPDYEMYARPLEEYPYVDQKAACIMLMIQNNLDPNVAQYPHELVTYGGNGSVFQNWIQYRITMHYLSIMNGNQTLVMYSGHPLGLFPSHDNSPRVVITNGMTIPNYSSQNDYEVMNALGVTQYGQMTAGSYMYIGPQGIVHGTTLTILNAARKYLNLDTKDGLGGILYVTSGLGGMSGAQAKAAVITGAVSIIADPNHYAAKKRHEQGWLSELYEELDGLIIRAKQCIADKEAVSLGYVGNIIDVWERLDAENIIPELGSDQTSLHNPWLGGYTPHGMSYQDMKEMISNNPETFKLKVKESLVRHVEIINKLSQKGMHFWDYGNAFLLESGRANADIFSDQTHSGFRYPSYVEDIMGPICFDYGFGPFRWVCSSGKNKDLIASDKIASKVLRKLAKQAPPEIQSQYYDNIRWIENAEENGLVVGSKARILYADERGRVKIAEEFNKAIADGRITAPIILGRDHHDVSGTDSPYRETANIKDGSMFTADMAVQNFIGDSFRGATWVSLHNGGGVGWGEVVNGGFGLVIDGSKQAHSNINSMLSWDVNNGIARRAWAQNPEAKFAIKRAMDIEKNLTVTVASDVSKSLLERIP
jgi:urocanate hydratase